MLDESAPAMINWTWINYNIRVLLMCWLADMVVVETVKWQRYILVEVALIGEYYVQQKRPIEINNSSLIMPKSIVNTVQHIQFYHPYNISLHI